MKNIFKISSLTLLFFTMVFCGQKKENIVIDGSSTVYPITQAVAEEFMKINKNYNVTVAISGTGGGFKKFCAGETDISNASREIKKKQKWINVKKTTSNTSNFQLLMMLLA
jgi:phosphate transport system substrate-binding protein